MSLGAHETRMKITHVSDRWRARALVVAYDGLARHVVVDSDSDNDGDDEHRFLGLRSHEILIACLPKTETLLMKTAKASPQSSTFFYF